MEQYTKFNTAKIQNVRMETVETAEADRDQTMKAIICPTKMFRLYTEVHREPQNTEIRGVTYFTFLKNHSGSRKIY